MAIACNGSGQIDLQTIVGGVNANETLILNKKLGDLKDVSAGSPNNGDVIIFNSVSGNWEAKPSPENQIPADWNQADNTKLDFIKNKPDMSTYEKSLGDPVTAGQVLTSTTGGVRKWVTQAATIDLSMARTANDVTVENTSGTDAILPASTKTMAGIMTGSDKTNLERLLVLITGGTF